MQILASKLDEMIFLSRYKFKAKLVIKFLATLSFEKLHCKYKRGYAY